LARDLAALNALRDPNYQWLVTPTVYKEFTRIAAGSASRIRFLKRLSNVTVLTNQARNLRSGVRFLQVCHDLRKAANQSRPGLGDRPISGGLKSHYNDIINAAFAAELATVYVTADRRFLGFLASHGSSAGVQAKHILNFP
jgi:hypothetical protein